MHRFSGEAAAVYAVGRPCRFEGLPLRDCGDGFEWRCADDSLLCWLDGEAVFEVYEQGEWGVVAPLAVQPAAGRATFSRCLTGKPVRVSGVGLPTTLVGEAGPWRLEQEVLSGRSLSGMSVTKGECRALLGALREVDWGLASVRSVLAVLASGLGVFTGLGQLVRGAESIVLFDQRGVCYGPR